MTHCTINLYNEDYEKFVNLSAEIFDGLNYNKLFRKVLDHFFDTHKDVKGKL